MSRNIIIAKDACLLVIIRHSDMAEFTFYQLVFFFQKPSYFSLIILGNKMILHKFSIPSIVVVEGEVKYVVIVEAVVVVYTAEVLENSVDAGVLAAVETVETTLL